jgi:hypothetical protein
MLKNITEDKENILLLPADSDFSMRGERHNTF